MQWPMHKNNSYARHKHVRCVGTQIYMSLGILLGVKVVTHCALPIFVFLYIIKVYYLTSLLR